MRKQCLKELGNSPIPMLGDTSVAFLPIDQSAGNPHQLNNHGWPPNNIQEYANSEDATLREMLIQNMEMHKAAMSPDAVLSDMQKAALCGSRYAGTSSEFVAEAMRLDNVRAAFERSKVFKQEVEKQETIKFNEEVKE